MNTASKMDFYTSSLKTADNLAQLITSLLFTVKSIQIRLEWTPVLHNISGSDNAKINQASHKTHIAIEQVLDILATNTDRRLTRESVGNLSHLGDAMMLQELVFQYPIGLYDELISTLEAFNRKHTVEKS
jgi:hypothetical protein